MKAEVKTTKHKLGLTVRTNIKAGFYVSVTFSGGSGIGTS